MRFLDLTLPTIEEDLALDEALLIEVEEGRSPPLLRLWEPRKPAVVLGASGRLAEVFVDRCRRDGVPIARRGSGGGTVVVGPGALNFSAILAKDAAPGLDAVDLAQRFVLERVADAIRDSGPAVQVLGSGDLTLEGRKVSGSAQRRLKGHFLVHATILYDFPLAAIDDYLGLPARQPSYRENRPHREFVANLPVSRDVLARALRTAWGPFAPEPVEIPTDRVAALVAEKFASPGWVERF